MSKTISCLGTQAREVAKDLGAIGDIAKDTVQEQLTQMHENANEYLEQGRETLHGIAGACEQYVHQRPLRSILIAASVGAILGCFWRRR